MNNIKNQHQQKNSENSLISPSVFCQAKKLPHSILIAVCEPPVETSAKAG